MPTTRGTADLGDFQDLQGPVEIYIGNIHPSISKERIVDFLVEKAERNKVADFKVVPLTKVENPCSHSWKLRVPSRLQVFMLSGHVTP